MVVIPTGYPSCRPPEAAEGALLTHRPVVSLCEVHLGAKREERALPSGRRRRSSPFGRAVTAALRARGTSNGGIRNAYGLLARFSLITRNQLAGFLAVHALVAEVTRLTS